MEKFIRTLSLVFIVSQCKAFNISEEIVVALLDENQLKNITNKSCYFPFIYNNRTYKTCVKFDREELWCATTNNYDRDRKWTWCNEEEDMENETDVPLKNTYIIYICLASVVITVLLVICFLCLYKFRKRKKKQMMAENQVQANDFVSDDIFILPDQVTFNDDGLYRRFTATAQALSRSSEAVNQMTFDDVFVIDEFMPPRKREAWGSIDSGRDSKRCMETTYENENGFRCVYPIGVSEQH